MTLLQVVLGLDSFDKEHTIYAAEPWTANSEAIVEMGPESGRGVPPAAQKLGLQYFIEVDIAQEFLEGWMRTRTQPTSIEQCDRLIQYAMNDA